MKKELRERRELNSRLEREGRLRLYVESMLKFVSTYCEYIQERKPLFNLIESFPFLPISFKNVVAELVNRTLNDSSLLELSSRVLHHHNRVDRLVYAFSVSYTNEFSDYRFIQWATMLCTLSSFLDRQGFELAFQIALNTINLFCNRHNRFQAFKSLGCWV